APEIAAARIDDSRIALPKSATTNSSTAALKHSEAMANFRCSRLRSANQTAPTAATSIQVNVMQTRGTCAECSQHHHQDIIRVRQPRAHAHLTGSQALIV